MLYLTLSYGSVDVNVHPAKTEVKFSEERKVFDAVYYAVLSALTGEERTKAPAAELPADIRPKENFYQSMSAEQFRANGYAAAPDKSGARRAARPPRPSRSPPPAAGSPPVCARPTRPGRRGSTFLPPVRRRPSRKPLP